MHEKVHIYIGADRSNNKIPASSPRAVFPETILLATSYGFCHINMDETGAAPGASRIGQRDLSYAENL